MMMMMMTSATVFEVVDYSEEKTIEKLQQFVNDIVSRPPSVAVCVFFNRLI